MGRATETFPSPPWGRGWPETASSSAASGRVRGFAVAACMHWTRAGENDHLFGCELLSRNEATRNRPSSGLTGSKSRSMLADPPP